MTENGGAGDWRYVGDIKEMCKRPCFHVHAKSGKNDDLVLLNVKNNFFAMEAWCGHAGGPLFEGDIEDHKGKPHIVCPWHGYMFNVESGRDAWVGIEQTTFPVKMEDGRIYVKYPCELSLIPYL